jgi:holliday junction DNA helicase RuvA
MIGKLKGLVDSVEEDALLLDVSGVCYHVFCSSRTLNVAPVPLNGAQTPLTLWIDMQVREDSMRLYGFLSASERDMFRLLQSVQGVGAKVALAIQSLFTADEIRMAIFAQDKASLGRAAGVGPKLAVRLVTELKDKIPANLTLSVPLSNTSDQGGAAQTTQANLSRAAADAISALVNLGYAQMQATAAIQTVVQRGAQSADPLKLEANQDTSQLIRLGLKELSA